MKYSELHCFHLSALLGKSKKNKKSSRSNTPVTNEKPKKLSRSATPVDDKPKKTSRKSSRASTPVTAESDNKENEQPLETTEKLERLTPTDKLFDMNGLFNVMDYLPQHLVSQ